VVLEAREFCSGATGRNAGHCKPDVVSAHAFYLPFFSLSFGPVPPQFRGFTKYEALHGAEQALKVRGLSSTSQKLINEDPVHRY
jgi:hypothetical protein